MAKSKKTNNSSEVKDYRYKNSKRKNIPSAGLTAQGEIKEVPKIQYSYDPHLHPALRFDATGQTDRLPELLAEAKRRPLNDDELKILYDAIRNREPWLEWSGKREKKSFEVDPVALHIHERISPQAIIKILKREDAQRDLFADPQLEYNKAIKFYEHDVDWTNRMILGDSLQVMASLAKRENLAGQVQMIYMDPPYGIKFSSNFQTEIGKRDVKDREADLTREPETIRAYRDTWKLGIHSYLSYMRDRLYLCKELLKDSGSIFVQISDENVHLVRNLLDEVFGKENFVSIITVAKTSGLGSKLLTGVSDFLLWYAKEIVKIKYQNLFLEKEVGGQGGEAYQFIEENNGFRRRANNDEILNSDLLIENGKRFFRLSDMRSQSGSIKTSFPVFFQGKDYLPRQLFWKTNEVGYQRLIKSERISSSLNSLNYIRYSDDFPAFVIHNIWTDLSSSVGKKIFVVQTNEKIIQRCLLMTTSPGDLVLDPTCGSGTTAYVAEQFGRRWITIDTSRVAISLARQRILTATFDYYKTKNGDGNNPSTGFIYETVPHITLKSIANNVALDSIFAKHEPILEQALKELNNSLKFVSNELRTKLQTKLIQKEKTEGKKSITDADRRRWILPKKEDGWKEWEVPFDTDEDWPDELKSALTNYRKLWRNKMDEVNACIQANAEMEELVDKPKIEKGITRVSGPFTVESVIPIEESLAEVEKYKNTIEEELETFDKEDNIKDAMNAETHIAKIIRLLQIDGVRFPNNKVLRFDQIQAVTGLLYLHAEGEWTTENGEKRKVAISVGPEKGDVTSIQVEDAIRSAARRGHDDLIFAGFNFDASAQAIIQEDLNPKVRCHLAHIRPDLYMGDLLKDSPTSQIFTVFGSPRTELKKLGDGQFQIEMQGVDIYDPVNNVLLPTNVDKVAAWFIDTDYDGKTFCITQAFFPDKSAWDKIARALKGIIDKEQFEKLSGTVSLPFPIGKNKRVAVKVIDPRGNEVIKVHNLSGNY